jgi:hypothetical protein
MSTARLLFDNYQRLTPPMLRNALPAWCKLPVLRLLYERTLHPDIAFLLARNLYRLEQRGQVGLRHTLAPQGFEDISDPLFDATLTPVRSDSSQHQNRGHFACEFGYFGLKIMARVPLAVVAPSQDASLSIRVAGHLLRRERLRTSKDGRWGTVRFVVKRPALALFPAAAPITVETGDGQLLANAHGGVEVIIRQENGIGDIGRRLELAGPLDKKGNLRPSSEEVIRRQDGYLALYEKVRNAFANEFGKPLFLLYGTLLGQHRSGDFIAGDDDFDVGYVSELTDPDQVRLEAVAIIERLAARGYTILVNREGKPFRIRDDQSGAELHLDNRPVFTLGDGNVWMHKHAKLPMSLQDFRDVSPGLMRGREVLCPAGTEQFLAAYYGENWRIPDPGFSNAAAGISPEVEATLGRVLLSRAEQIQLTAGNTHHPGRFLSTTLHPPYPLDAYAKDIGW